MKNMKTTGVNGEPEVLVWVTQSVKQYFPEVGEDWRINKFLGEDENLVMSTVNLVCL